MADPRANWLADELDNFREIARHLNPSPGETPQIPGVEICGFSEPLREVIGGDHILFIDFHRRYDLDTRIAEAQADGRVEVARTLELLRNRAGILVADVSGHRVTDALVAAMLHQAFLVGAYYELDLFGEITTRIFEHINSRFYKTTAVNKYFTMIYGEISAEGRFRFISAGHQPPAIFSREYGKFVKISADRQVSFPPVGMFPSSTQDEYVEDPSPFAYKKRYEVNEINLLAFGDILLLYSDGLSDHGNGDYFPQRLEGLMAEIRDESASTICRRVREDVLAFAKPEDDISVVVIRKSA
jgi:serine phosphatase RsbU (regulator of sigma subunit)